MMSSEIQVLIADGHPVVRVGVNNLLQNNPSIKVVGEVEDGDETITETLNLLPDILLLDLTMPRLPGLEAMRAIMSGYPKVKVLLLNRLIRAQHIIEALQIGARGVVLHDRLPEDLEPAIRCVSDGGYWLGHERVDSLVGALHKLVNEQAVPDQKNYGLTRRELEVIRSIVDGLSNRDIAAKFSLSEETVKRHLSNIFDKVGVSTRLELALFAISHNLVAS
jgi:two-component system, NarL family, nitrate/nitrite response regulator NarL